MVNICEWMLNFVVNMSLSRALCVAGADKMDS